MVLHCTNCRHPAEPAARFCSHCGAALPRACPHCGAAAAADAKFCNQCGGAISAAAISPLPDLPAGDGSVDRDGDRRQLTVLFCDIAGSTALSHAIDPEPLRAILRAYQEACAGAVARVDGHLAKYMGDGVMAYFGYPRAHGDDARRAVLAGLDMVRQVRGLSRELLARTGRKLKVRIGIHTGLVVTGELGAGESRERLGIVGETPNIAARLQAVAERNCVVISADTRHLVADGFRLRPLGPQRLKGLANPVEVFEVEAPLDRSEDAPLGATTPLAGRDQESALLLDRWEQAREGSGQAVLVSGEAGIGKSRLLRALRDAIAGASHGWNACQCSPFFQNTPFYPVVELLPRLLGLAAGDEPTTRIERIRAALRGVGLADESAVGLIAQLIGVPSEDPRHAPDPDPAQRRKRTIETLLSWLVAGAAMRPTVLVIEDLHWADSSTVELIGLLLDQLPAARVLAIMTFRPEFQPPWPMRSFLASMSLRRLGGTQVAAIANRVAGASLPDEVLQQILAKTDGVPLYVEELTKAIVETGQLVLADGRYALAGPIRALAIPATLRDSLTARLDQLSSVKALTQLAATIGREFDYGLLAAVWQADGAALDRDLKTLVSVEILYQRGLPPASTYIFKHALIQDAAYESLLHTARQHHHRLIAEAYEKRFGEGAYGQPEEIARHFSEAGSAERAGVYWEQAGDNAVERWANADAMAHYRKALDQSEMLPPSPERDQREIGVLLKLGPAVAATSGMAAAEMGEVYRRAAEIARRHRLQRELCTALWGNWLYLWNSGNGNAAIQQADEIVALGQQLGDEHLLLQSFHARWTTSNLQGKHEQVRGDTARGVALYDKERHHRLSFAFGGHDPGVCARATGAIALWLTGHGDRALDMAADALRLGDELAHPFSRGIGMWLASMVEHGCGALDRAGATGERMVELAERHRLAMIGWYGRAMLGRCHFDRAERDRGLPMLEAAVADMAGMSGGYANYFRCLLVEALALTGRTGDALDLVERCIASARAGGQAFFLPDQLRLKGDCLLAASRNDPGDGAESLYREAMSLAESQGAVVLRLRAALSMARLWREQGRGQEAQAMIADMLGRLPKDTAVPELAAAREFRA